MKFEKPVPQWKRRLRRFLWSPWFDLLTGVVLVLCLLFLGPIAEGIADLIYPCARCP